MRNLFIFVFCLLIFTDNYAEEAQTEQQIKAVGNSAVYRFNDGRIEVPKYTFIDALELWRQGAKPEAIQIVSDLFAKNLNPSIGLHLGEMLAKERRYDEAAEALFNVCQLFAAEGDKRQAVNSFNLLQAINTANSEKYSELVDLASLEVARLQNN
jgi:hypothetical protein